MKLEEASMEELVAELIKRIALLGEKVIRQDEIIKRLSDDLNNAKRSSESKFLS